MPSALCQFPSTHGPRRACTLATTLALALAATGAAATPFNLVSTIHNPTPAQGDGFGRSVSLDGTTALIGELYGDTNVADSGTAYLYNAQTATLLHTLANPTPAPSDQFGFSVSLAGGTAVVGARLDDGDGSDAGAAYIFDANTGALTHTLTHPAAAAGDQFGWQVATDGVRTVVAAPFDDAGASTNEGSAHVFDASGALVTGLANPGTAPTASDYFGLSVDISGNVAIVGAALDDETAGNSGRAFLMDATTGALLFALDNPTPASGDEFGYSVAIDGNRALVAAPFDDAGAPDAGAVYLFDVTTGGLLHTFLNPTPGNFDFFGGFDGSAIAIDGDTVAIGAYRDDTAGSTAGAVYIFDALSGSLLQTITTPDATPAGDAFGWSVSLSGDGLLIGALANDEGAVNSGSVYYYARAPAPPVPEPATLALLAFGLLGGAAAARRR